MKITEKNYFDRIIAKQVSRFVRNVLDSLNYTFILQKLDLCLYIPSNVSNNFPEIEKISEKGISSPEAVTNSHSKMRTFETSP